MRTRRALIALGLITLVFGFAGTAAAQPTLSKVFTPNIIGPGATSTATFTITNLSASPVTDLAFTDTFPLAITLADPANAMTDCDLGASGTLTAPDGGSTVTLAGAQIGGSTSCTINVDVTASTPGLHTNPAVTLSSSAGSSMSLAIDLTVVTTLPGFSKSFAPSSVALGEKSTLTFTIDNGANPSRVGNLSFSDNLPVGMVVADPANASTDCVSASAPDTTLVATPGTSVIILDASGSTFFPGFEVLPIGATCMVAVDVVSTGIGMLDNVTTDLLADFTSAGKASDTLEVTVTPLNLTKAFTDDPVPPGNNVELEFVLTNTDRNFSATDVGFTDNLTTLAPPLPGLTFDSITSNDCSQAPTGVGGTTIALSGVTLAPEASCTLVVSLAVPPAATPAAYTNTTSTITGTVDGSPVIGNTASDDLFVEPVPLLTKEFLEDGTLNPDPIVAPGDDVVLRFTITNTSTTSGATDVTFIDELTDGGPGTGFLPFPLSVVLPPTPCGPASALGFVFPDTDRQALELTGGTLAASGMPGDSCTFDVTVTIPEDLATGVYSNTTGPPSATVDGATRLGEPASDTLTVVAAPTLTKSFIDDPVAPGDSVTLEFTLENSPNAPTDATGITFTDNLAPVLASLVATGLPLMEACDPDGPGGDPGTGTLSASAGDTLLTFMGGELAPGETCTFSVTLDVPAGAAPGSYTNTTSGVGATIAATAATSPATEDDLDVSGLVFTKEFLGDPVIAGDTLTLRFTIDNIHPTQDATITFFTDNLQLELTGLAATGMPSFDDCGGAFSGTTFIIYTGGSVMAGTSCTIEVEVEVPAGTADGSYVNITSSLSATQGGAVSADPAIDVLEVSSTLLELTKEFTDDPVPPGDSVTLELTLTNLDGAQAASDIDFSDNLGAALAGLTFDSVLLDDCNGSTTGTGTDTITVMGASLGAGASCTIRVSLTVPPGADAGIYTNTTSAVIGMLGGFAVVGEPASDDLEVVQLLIFSKSFDGPTTPTGFATLTFTITNPGADTASGIGFTDDLNDVIPGLIATSLPALPCGAGSSITGIGFLTFSGGELPPLGGTCSFDVDVLVPATATAGTFPNVTSDLFQSGLPVADPATADLTIEERPDFSKSFSPSAIDPFGTSTLTFTIDNTLSSLAATGLAFLDALPAGVTIVEPPVTSNTCGGTLTTDVNNEEIELTGGMVGAGATCLIQVAVTSMTPGAHVNTSGDLTSSGGNSGPAMATLTVNQGVDLTVTKADSPDPVVAGGTLTYTITVTNNGDVNATNVIATDTLPAGVTVVSTSGCAEDPSGVPTCNLGTINGSGASKMYTISVTVDPATTGMLTNTVSVASDAMELNTGDNTAMATTTVEQEADLSITKVESVEPAVAGGQLTYTVTVTNNGPSDATGVVVSDTLPAELTLVSTSGCAEDPAGSPTCTLGAIAASSSAMFTITADIDPDTRGIISNTATVSSSTTDPVAGNNSATENTTVVGEVDLMLTKVDDADPPGAGANITYTITVDNPGPSTATNVVVVDTLPAEVTLVDTSGCAEDPAGVPTCTLPDIPPGGSEQYTIEVSIDPGPPAMITNTATVTSDETELNPSDNTDEEDTTLDIEPPEVTSVGTPFGADGEIEDCETVLGPVTTITVEFDEEVFVDPGGDAPEGADPDSAENPANYWLIGPGPDLTFDTTMCGPPVGNDTAIAIDSVSYDADTSTSTLQLNGGGPIPDSQYRMIVCGSTSIIDLAGNPLDGDGDGTGGDDFVLDFRVDQMNSIKNGHFDCDLSTWTLTYENGGEWIHNPTVDCEGSPESGSAHLPVPSLTSNGLLSQCMAATDAIHEFSSSVRVDAAVGDFISYSQTCTFYGTTDCTGAPLGDLGDASSLLDTGGNWIELASMLAAPAGSASVQCEIQVENTGAVSFDAYVDQVRFVADEGALFADGFESGDISAWSSTVGGN